MWYRIFVNPMQLLKIIVGFLKKIDSIAALLPLVITKSDLFKHLDMFSEEINEFNFFHIIIDRVFFDYFRMSFNYYIKFIIFFYL